MFVVLTQNTSQGKITYHLFSTTDQEEHARMKRPIVKYYSQGSVLTLEPLMDTVIGDFCDHLETRFMKDNQQIECDLGQWIGFCERLHYFISDHKYSADQVCVTPDSWDMNGAASFSQRFGYMDTGRDHDKTIEIADKALDYFAAVGQMPFLDFLMDKNPVMRIGPPNLGNITRIAGTFILSTHVKDRERELLLNISYYSGTSRGSFVRQGSKLQPTGPRLSAALPQCQEHPPRPCP